MYKLMDKKDRADSAAACKGLQQELLSDLKRVRAYDDGERTVFVARNSLYIAEYAGEGYEAGVDEWYAAVKKENKRW